MGQGRKYTTAIVIGVLVVSLLVLGARWHALGQRVPLTMPAAAVSGDTSARQKPDHTADPPPAKATEPVDINTASARELELLPGIGPVLARRIIDFRQAHGPFKSLRGLLKVSGIGEKKLAALKDRVVCPAPGGAEYHGK